jgi:cysteinyl-tRNA synthetase
MPLLLHDTLTGERRPFKTAEPNHAKLYVCGPTVNDTMHLGHVRAYSVYDVLVRHLRDRG